MAMIIKRTVCVLLTALILILTLPVCALAVNIDESGLSQEEIEAYWDKRFSETASPIEKMREIPASSYPDLRTVSVTFTGADSSADFVCDFPYADSMFTMDPDIYSHKLAQASLGLAVAAFRRREIALSSLDQYICAYFTNTGFKDVQTDDYLVVPSIDTIGTAIAHKKIDSADGSFTLVAIGISGAQYFDEWMSNFSIGDSDVHDGFEHASGLVMERYKKYVADNALEGPIKVWLTGFSRAAAVSNITSARLTDMQREAKSNPAANTAVAPEAVYCYSFGTPNTTKTPGNYQNIFSIAGQFDPVPSVPLAEWGFSRYGTTLHLPAKEVDRDFEERFARAQVTYKRITGKDMWVNPEGNWLIYKVCEFVSDLVVSSEQYKKSYQQMFINLWQAKGSKLNLIMTALNDITSSEDLRNDLMREQRELIALASQETYNLTLSKLGLRRSSWNPSESLSANLMHEHFQQTYVAWMTTFETGDETFSNSSQYKRLAITGPVDIEIYYNTDVVGEIKDDDLVEGEGHTLSILHIGDEFLISLPGNEEYAIIYTGNAEGKINYVLREHTSGSTAARTFMFSNIDVTKDNKYMSLINKGEQEHLLDNFIVNIDTEETLVSSGNSNSQDGEHGFFSELMLPGNNSTNFLNYVAMGAAGLLVLLCFGIWFIVHRHRKKKRERKIASRKAAAVGIEGTNPALTESAVDQGSEKKSADI